MKLITDLLHKLHNAQGLEEVIAWGGFIVLVLIVFSETGLCIGFFLPGDSMLFVAGFLVGTGVLKAPAPLPQEVVPSFIALNLALMLAAFAGNSTGYWFGSKIGPPLYNRPESWWFKPKLLLKARELYEQQGARVIILAEFMPFARTFAPIVAGISQLEYRRFITYNVMGVIIWIGSMTTLGFLIGNASFNVGGERISVRDHLDKAIILVILLSISPGLLHLWKAHLEKQRGEHAEAGHTVEVPLPGEDQGETAAQPPAAEGRGENV